MTPGLLMLLGGGAIIIAIIGAIINFLVIAKRATHGEVGFGGFGFAMVVHIICGLFSGGGVLALIGGFIWFLLKEYKG